MNTVAPGLRVEGSRRGRQADGGECCGITTAPPDDLASAADVLRAMADPTRLGILALLMEHETLCVCHIVSAFPLGQPTISHHLRLLRRVRLVDCWRRGTWCYYHLLPAARPIVAWAVALPQKLHAAYDEGRPSLSDGQHARGAGSTSRAGSAERGKVDGKLPTQESRFIAPAEATGS